MWRVRKCVLPDARRSDSRPGRTSVHACSSVARSGRIGGRPAWRTGSVAAASGGSGAAPLALPGHAPEAGRGHSGRCESSGPRVMSLRDRAGAASALLHTGRTLGSLARGGQRPSRSVRRRNPLQSRGGATGWAVPETKVESFPMASSSVRTGRRGGGQSPSAEQRRGPGRSAPQTLLDQVTACRHGPSAACWGCSSSRTGPDG